MPPAAGVAVSELLPRWPTKYLRTAFVARAAKPAVTQFAPWTGPWTKTGGSMCCREKARAVAWSRHGLAICIFVLVPSIWPQTSHKAPLYGSAYPPISKSGGGQIWIETIYLPPVTTGPWAPAWSPDAREIVFSMQGSLWKVPAGGGEAVQVTSGPHYDSEPSWSPDGTQIAFTRDTGKVIEIWLVNADGSDPRQLTHAAAISVNPRWSPIGDAILHTSSAGGESLGLWAVSPRDGSARAVLVDSFQNLSGAWSADGKEIVFVSNRRWEGKSIPGSGGIWKLRVGAREPTLLQQEETFYQARPVWSPDGGKIAYVSFRGGDHQLWLLSPNLGNPSRLTFYESEAFAPAWSFDGRKIAFVSNFGGKFTLRTVSATGGPSSEVNITGLKHRYPVGRLQVVVRDAATGLQVAGRVYLQASDGKSYAPLGSFHRALAVTNEHYFHTAGSFSLNLPAGRATVEVMRGFEYRPKKKDVEIVAGQTRKLEIALTRLANLQARGWYSGDTHVHSETFGTLAMTPQLLLQEAESEDLHVINNLIHNQETRILGIQLFKGKLDAASRSGRLLYTNQEYRESFPGHLALLNLKAVVFPSYVGSTRVNAYPALSQVLDAAHAQGAVGGFVHPFYGEGSNLPRRSREFPITVALGKLDFYDVMSSWSDDLDTSEKWYRALNLGFRIPATAGTDSFPDVWRSPAMGMVRVYAQSGSPLTYDGWLRGVTAGRTFVTNGPLLFLKVEGKGPGDTLQFAPGQSSSVSVEADATSIVPMERLDILQNGKVVHTVKSENPFQVKLVTTLTVERSGWLAARVTGPPGEHFLMDNPVFAHTSPVYLSVTGAPARSPEDARYFLGWIDEMLKILEEASCERRGSITACFDTAVQKEEVVAYWRKAREVYSRLAGE